MSTKTWNIDPVHSEIHFRARHMVVSTVTGQFDRFDATAETEGDTPENAKVTFTAETASVNTGTEQRDNHLRSDDFFNAEKFPTLTFKSTSFKNVKEDIYQLKGDLTIRDVTKPIELDVEYGGMITDPYGNQRSGFTVTGKVSRKDFGLRYNALLESGGAVVSDEIKINCHVEFIHHD
ncbi:MAG TPA: YceI family protein [Chitinophagaceae bacterium]|nr:YceI family protein [Chitinophagaceae bacterium]